MAKLLNIFSNFYRKAVPNISFAHIFRLGDGRKGNEILLVFFFFFNRKRTKDTCRGKNTPSHHLRPNYPKLKLWNSICFGDTRRCIPTGLISANKYALRDVYVLAFAVPVRKTTNNVRLSRIHS